MSVIKRTFWFLLINLLVVLTISFFVNITGIQPYLTGYGISYESLLIFSFIWGMGGSLVSLALSRVLAKTLMGVQVISPDTRDYEAQELLNTVYQLAKKANLPAMPEVGVYNSIEINAFATGPSKSRSLIAVSRGLLMHFKNAEVQGVLAHEIAHIANGDMVTMTLLQGIINTFVMFFARVVSFVLSSASRERESEDFSFMTYYIIVNILEVILMLFGSVFLAFFSRIREFDADAGGAKLAGKEKMIKALQALKQSEFDDSVLTSQVKFLKISGSNSLLRLFATHPSLDERISRLEQMR